jgi:hypothetical protein
MSLLSCSTLHYLAVVSAFQRLQELQCVESGGGATFNCKNPSCPSLLCHFFAALSEAIHEGGCDPAEACNMRGESAVDVCRPFLDSSEFWDECGANITVADACATEDTAAKKPGLDVPALANELRSSWSRRSTRFAVEMKANIWGFQGNLTFLNEGMKFEGTISSLNGAVLGSFQADGASNVASSRPSRSWIRFARVRHLRLVGGVDNALLRKSVASSEKECQQYCESEKGCDSYSFRYLNMTDMEVICAAVSGNASDCVGHLAYYAEENCRLFLQNSNSPTAASPTAVPTYPPTGSPGPAYAPTNLPTQSFERECGCEEIGGAFCKYEDTSLSTGRCCEPCVRFEYAGDCALAELSFAGEQDCRKWCFAGGTTVEPAVPKTCNVPSLFFSQFQEAVTGNNRYYQIFNPFPWVISLGMEYSIAFCTNGCKRETAFLFENGHRFLPSAAIPAFGTYTM